MIEYIRDKQIGVEKGGFIRIDPRDITLCEFIRRAEVIDVTINNRMAGRSYGLPSWGAGISQHHRI